MPNYNLQRAHDENEVFQQVPVLTFGSSLRCSRLKLWDEESQGARHLRRGPGEPARRLARSRPQRHLGLALGLAT